MLSKFWFVNLHYKDFTVDETDKKLILREVLKKIWSGFMWFGTGWSDGHECGNEPAGFVKVANFSCSATVSFSNTSYGSHAQPKSVSPVRIYSMTPGSGVKWIKLYHKFILTSPLHANHNEIPFQPLRITSRIEHL